MSNPTLRERCQYFRMRVGYKQKELADLLFVAPSTLSKWENGTAPWPPGAIERYAELLHLNETEGQEFAALARNIHTLELCPKRDIEPLADVNGSRFPKEQEAYKPAQGTPAHVLLAGTGILLISILSVVALRLWLWGGVGWQETFNTNEQRWMQISARWEGDKGPRSVLRENNPAADFGKVESDVIHIDVDRYPILHVEVGIVDPDASYTVQILDKRTNTSKDVLKGITYSGEQIINLAREMNWHGEQIFTINVWISGERKSATFHRISIEKT